MDAFFTPRGIQGGKPGRKKHVTKVTKQRVPEWTSSPSSGWHKHKGLSPSTLRGPARCPKSSDQKGLMEGLVLLLPPPPFPTAAASATGLAPREPWAPTWKPNHASFWVLTSLGSQGAWTGGKGLKGSCQVVLILALPLNAKLCLFVPDHQVGAGLGLWGHGGEGGVCGVGWGGSYANLSPAEDSRAFSEAWAALRKSGGGGLGKAAADHPSNTAL